MPGVKISSLNVSATFTDTDVIPVVSGGITKKVTGAVVKAAIGVPSAGVVGTTQLANGSVTTPKLAPNAADSTIIADLAVQTAKINDSAVTTIKILDSNVTLGKLESSVQETLSRAGQARSGTTIPTTGSVKGVVVLAGGSGYTSGATVSIAAPPSGTTATATATVASGIVTAITIVMQGSGYTDQNPVVTITPTSVGVGSGASAVAYAMIQPLIVSDSSHSVSGDTSFQAIASNDNIITAGSNTLYPLGIGPNTNNIVSNAVNIPLVGTDGVKVKPIKIFSGSGITYILANDGSLWSSGYNSNGEVGRGFSGNAVGVGNNNTVFKKITFSGGGIVKKFAVNNSFGLKSTCLAVVQTSTTEQLFGWGNNNTGQLGNGTVAAATTPQVLTCSDGASAIVDIAVVGQQGYAVCLVLFASGRVKAAGYNVQAQLSRGNNDSQTSFAFVNSAASTPLTDVVEIGGMGATSSQVFFRTSTGYIYSAGNNNNGFLGQGNTTDSTTYVAQVIGGSTWETGLTRSMFLCGSQNAGFGFAFKAAGTLFGWGHNGFGQLGLGTASNTNATPTVVSGFTRSTVANISTVLVDGISNYGSSAILKTDGSIWCAGANPVGQLGLGHEVDVSTFSQVPMDKSVVKDICFVGQTSPNYYLGVLATDGSFYTCGNNTNGFGLRGYDSSKTTARLVQGNI